jgi:hypothetical protein
MSETLRESVMGDDTKAGCLATAPATLSSSRQCHVSSGPTYQHACCCNGLRYRTAQESHDNIDPEDGLPRRYAPRNDNTVYDKMD